MRRIAILVVLGIAAPACFSPTFPNCRISCGAGHECPDDSTCDQGFCRIRGGASCLPVDAGADTDADAHSGQNDDVRAETPTDDGGMPDTVDDRGDVPAPPDGPDAETRDGSDPETPDGPDTETPDASDGQTPDGPDAEMPDASDAGTPDGSDAGDATPPRPTICTASAVSSCPEGLGGQCEETFCGGRLWPAGGSQSSPMLVSYRILDPQSRFPANYKAAIKSAADAWAAATSALVTFNDCSVGSPCVNRFVSVIPGDGDGIMNPSSDGELFLPMPVDPGSLATLPLHRIAHQWGHVLGLGHTYERADRDRYVRFDPKVWCGPNQPGVPPRCAFGPAEFGSPPIASDTFGVYDEQSKMNEFALDGICGNSEPQADVGTPTDGDGAAVQELFNSRNSYWAPFRPLGHSVDPSLPLDYQLSPGVDPTGTPAIASFRSPGVEIFVRGTDNAVYGIHNQLTGSVFDGWSAWETVATNVDADPAVVFADEDTLFLAVRSQDGIFLRMRMRGTWSSWTSLGAPAAGAASAPAIAAPSAGALSIVVLGGDGHLYELSCADSASLCAASGGSADAWSPLPPPPRAGGFIGKPSLVMAPTTGWLYLTGVTDDRTGWLIGTNDQGWGSWVPMLPFDLPPDDTNPSIAVDRDTTFYARNSQRRLVNGNPLYYQLGGVLASNPAVVSARAGSHRHIDVAAIVDDHGAPGVWWKFWDGDGYIPPCNYNAPGTCAQCGCNVPGGPSCTD